jgi:hypothetical protein
MVCLAPGCTALCNPGSLLETHEACQSAHKTCAQHEQQQGSQCRPCVHAPGVTDHGLHSCTDIHQDHDCSANPLPSNLDPQHAQAQRLAAALTLVSCYGPPPDWKCLQLVEGHCRPTMLTCSVQTAPSVVHNTASAYCLVCAETPAKAEASNSQHWSAAAANGVRHQLQLSCVLIL